MPIVNSTAPWGCVLVLKEKLLNTSQHAFSDSQLLPVDVTSCLKFCLNFSAVMDYNLEL